MENENFEKLMQKILSVEKIVSETQDFLLSWKRHSVIKKKSPNLKAINDLIDRKVRSNFSAENDQEIQKILYTFDCETVLDLSPEDYEKFYAIIENLEE